MRASAAEAALKVAKEGVAAAEAAVPARLAGRPATLARLLLGDAEGGADGGMWAVAASEFAKIPYSNGRDRRYEEVKAALRQRYGRDAISECTKPRLKALPQDSTTASHARSNLAPQPCGRSLRAASSPGR